MLRDRRLRALRQARPAGAFLGIVPAEYTTDTKRRLGSITKAGSSHARRLLVEAAWHYRRLPAGITLARRQRGIDPRVIAIAWRGQERLHERYTQVNDERRKPAGVINIANARELACFSGRPPRSTDPNTTNPRPGVAAGARRHHARPRAPPRRELRPFYGHRRPNTVRVAPVPRVQPAANPTVMG